jgi:hypothetical protein
MKDVLILPSVSREAKFSVHLVFKDEEELNKAIEVLKPLGYSFRMPKR